MANYPWTDPTASDDDNRSMAEMFLQSAMHSQAEMQRLGVPQPPEHKAAIEAAETFLREQRGR